MLGPSMYKTNSFDRLECFGMRWLQHLYIMQLLLAMLCWLRHASVLASAIACI